MKTDKEKIRNELAKINDLIWEIQGQLNTITDSVTKISGNLLHNLQVTVYSLEDKLNDKPVVKESFKPDPCCYDN
jgi:hypothetical protein